MLAEKIQKFISANSLIKHGQSVLVAFSGGADSMCLLHVLKSLSYDVSAAHMNHMLRGDEADNDEEVARQFCEKYDIPFYVSRVDIASIAKQESISEETAGRNERYKFFDLVAQNNCIDKIATAHNKDDNAETILMHIIRGCGTSGLAGIPKMRGNIIRPLIDCSRSEIEEYCRNHNLHYVTDSTNLTTLYTRNKVRHELIPILREYNSNILSAFSALSELMTADKKYFENKIKEITGNSTSISIKKLEKLPNALLYRVISKLSNNASLSPEFRHIKAVADIIKCGSSGKRIDIPGGIIEISCGKISAIQSMPEDFCHSITSESEIELDNFRIFSSSDVESNLHFTLPFGSEILLRSRRPGDKIKVRGMTKKLSDLFTDKKIPASERNKIPVLSVDGEIIYVFGIEKSDLIAGYTKNDKTFVLNIINKEYTNE